MSAEKLYENLDENSKRQLRRLAEEMGEKDAAGNFKGNVILFVGAGVNYHSPAGFEDYYRKENRPPMGSELAELYLQDLFCEDTTKDRYNKMVAEKLPLSWVTQYYETVFDRTALIKKLSEFIGINEVSPILKALANMPFKYIVTTNYDNLFERALASAGKEIHKGIYKPNNNRKHESTFDVDEKEVTITRPFLFKLHGDLEDSFSGGNYNPDSDAIVLTDEDYLHFILRMGQVVNNIERNDNAESAKNFNPIPQTINMAFNGLQGRRFLFIGYSLRDYNLRLIFKTALWKKDNNIFRELQKWSIDTEPDKAIKDIWVKNYNLTFIEQDIWETIPYLYKKIFNEEIPLK